MTDVSTPARLLAPTGTLRAAINFGNTVLAQRGPTLEESGGVSVAIARELARRLGVPLALVPFDGAGAVVAAAKNDVFDVAFLAIDPLRAQDLQFSAPYVLIEGGYLVRRASPLADAAEVDRPGRRMAVGRGSAYDLYLTRTLEHARIARAETSDDAIELFLRDDLDVVAGVKASLIEAAQERSELRVLSGRFMVIEQAMATVRGAEAAQVICALIEELKASGFIARELARSGQTEAAVAPGVKQMSTFVWYDVMTTDRNAAAAFYETVVGWRAADSGMPGMEYTIFSVGETMVAGAMALPAEMAAGGARPCWTGYVGVSDVDACAAQVSAAGGSVQRPPQDIPGVGRFAVVADPDGAAFIIFAPNGEGEPSPAGATPGRVGWHELYASDFDRAFAFYAQLFGWTKAEAIDMGAMGPYQMFAAGATPIGGMMRRPPELPPHWLYYFNVEAIDAAIARVTGNGGTILHGPEEVPGGSWIVQCADPQGAAFAMVGPRR